MTCCRKVVPVFGSPICRKTRADPLAEPLDEPLAEPLDEPLDEPPPAAGAGPGVPGDSVPGDSSWACGGIRATSRVVGGKHL
jgi:hypothetical protein